MVDPPFSQKAYRRARERLANVKKTGQPQKVIELCNQQLAYWEEFPHQCPDDWTLWERSRNDAEIALKYDLPYRP